MIGQHVLKDKYLYLQRSYGIKQRSFGIPFILEWRSLHSAMAGSIGSKPGELSNGVSSMEKLVVPEQAEQKMVMIRQALGAYSLKDQFNCDETALLWKQTPARSLSTRQLPGRKRRKQGSLLYSAAMQMSLRNWNHGLLELLGIHMLLELQA